MQKAGLIANETSLFMFCKTGPIWMFGWLASIPIERVETKRNITIVRRGVSTASSCVVIHPRHEALRFHRLRVSTDSGRIDEILI